MHDFTRLADLYVNVWNEPDPQRRRDTIAQLWTPEGQHYVRTRKAIGYAELEVRVRGSHQKNVAERGYRFRRAGEAQPLHDSVMFPWEMFHPDRPQVVEACGVQFLRLAPDGRVAVDYQFILPTPEGMTSEVMGLQHAAR
jgi:hypothetical protein